MKHLSILVVAIGLFLVATFWHLTRPAPYLTSKQTSRSYHEMNRNQSPVIVSSFPQHTAIGSNLVGKWIPATDLNSPEDNNFLSASTIKFFGDGTIGLLTSNEYVWAETHVKATSNNIPIKIGKIFTNRWRWTLLVYPESTFVSTDVPKVADWALVHPFVGTGFHITNSLLRYHGPDDIFFKKAD